MTRTPLRLFAAAATALLASITLALLATPLPAAADVLWDQSTVDEMGPGYFNSMSGSLPFGLTLYTVSDISVGGAGWTIDSVSETYSGLDPGWGLAIESGKLVVFPKSGALPLPGDDPTAGTTVAMSAVYVPGEINNHWVVTASGLNLSLTPGEYWIGITPTAPSGFFGPEAQNSTTTPVGDASPWYDPEGAMGSPGWSVPNAGTDAAILITGTLQNPTPTARHTWGGLKALYR